MLFARLVLCLLLALALGGAAAPPDIPAQTHERLAQAAELAREFPDEAVTIIFFAAYHPDVDLSKVAEFRRRLGDFADLEINGLLRRVFMPTAPPPAPPPPPPRMSFAEFVDHMAVIHLYEKQNHRPVRTQRVTPDNIVAVRRFMILTQYMPCTMIFAVLQENIDSLQDLDMPNIYLPTFAEIRNALPREYYEANREWFERVPIVARAHLSAAYDFTNQNPE